MSKMANAYLISKWRMYFKVLDVKNEGCVTKEHITQDKTKFAHFHHLEDNRKEEMMTRIEQWWNKYILQEKPGPISEQEFVDMLNEDFKADRDKFVKKMQTCFEQAFEINNLDGGELLSEEDFVIAFRAAGHEQITLEKKFFNAYNPVDGLVPIKQIVESWVQFMSSEDSSKPDIVKSALGTGV
ncbi:sarcoplasmic calcium-binding protein-like [Mercenaria mercenaria]|uniref:sarcoplasmic calcium-binding protein-like n=1 Tax=Mercenaria mercenaria TaxID=6596 RepID=UPI00234EE328|nr:sarcoplasmic calcium-binding protein-like [Mercenaria mercenaria]